MKEFKGSAGPWFISQGYSKLYVGSYIDGGMIQEVAACGPCDKGQVQQFANANLIAAAPELLELLIWLIDIEVPQPGHSEWASRVNSAIAKALGESK